MSERAYDRAARRSHRKPTERGEILRHGDPRALRIVLSDARFALSTLEKYVWLANCLLIGARRIVRFLVAIARLIHKREKEMSKVLTKLFLLAGFAAVTILPNAHADEWNQKTVLTFATPIEMPGQTLPAGTYVFKWANSNSSRHIVQVFNKEENRLFGTFLAIPSHRRHASEKTIIRFEERAAGSPQAIKAWFYPNKKLRS
jgi:hypothetical protein